MAKAIENSLDVENGGSVLNINKLKIFSSIVCKC